MRNKQSRISRRSPSTWRSWRPAGARPPGFRSTARSTARRRCPNFTEPFGRIDLAGITLNLFGSGGLEGTEHLLTFGGKLGAGNPNDGTDMPVDPRGTRCLPGQGVPYGWLVTPHAGTAADRRRRRGDRRPRDRRGRPVRAQIRLPFNSTAKMVFAVSDENGNILGLYRMPDATYFSIGVAVAKARNVAYYDNPSQLQPIDKIKGVPAGTALTARTFRYLSLPFFPEGIDINPPGPGSILTDGGVTKYRHEQGSPPAGQGLPEPPGLQRLQPQHELPRPVQHGQPERRRVLPRQRAVVQGHQRQRPTSQLVGGLGVSGDGVFQDDDVTAVARSRTPRPARSTGPTMVKVRGVRLPFFKFNRNPHVPDRQPDRSRNNRLCPCPCPRCRK